MTGFVGEERAVDIGCLDFRKVSCKMLIDKICSMDWMSRQGGGCKWPGPEDGDQRHELL